MDRELAELEPIETSIIQLPGAALAITNYREQALQLLEYAKTKAIATVADVKAVTDDLSIIAKSKKLLEEKRREYITPLNEQIKVINETFALVSVPLSGADMILRGKVSAFRAEQERQRLEAERINALRMEAARAEMALNGDLTEAVNLVEVAPMQPTQVQTDMGTLGTAKIRKWAVVDLSKVPVDYLVIDAVKVGKVVRAGIPSIPGIHIWTEESLRVTSDK